MKATTLPLPGKVPRGSTRCDWLSWSFGDCNTWRTFVREDSWPMVKQMHGKAVLVIPGAAMDVVGAGQDDLSIALGAVLAKHVDLRKSSAGHVSRIDLCREFRGSVKDTWRKLRMVERSPDHKHRAYLDGANEPETLECGRRGDIMIRCYDRFFKTGEARHERARVEVQLHGGRMPPGCQIGEAVGICWAYLDQVASSAGAALDKISHFGRRPETGKWAQRRAWHEAAKHAPDNEAYNLCMEVLARINAQSQGGEDPER